MNISIDRSDGKPIFLQIADEVMRLLDDGQLREGLRLPPSRDLARTLAVNRNTVVSAYQELISRGRANAHTGRGTFLQSRPRPEPAGGALSWGAHLGRAADARSLADSLDLHGVPTRDDGISFARNFPPLELLPVEPFRQVLDDVLRDQGAQLLTYGSPAGHRPLREWIAARMQAAGADVSADEVIVTTGSQQAIELAARALIDPGDRVLMEEPGFTLAIGAFRVHGARVEGVAVDGEGMRPDDLARALQAGPPPKLLYLVPNFQNPTGVCLSLSRREQILDLAWQHRVPVVEDDSGGALRFAGKPLPPLRALDRRGLTLYLSTFSKQLLPGLRVGWLCAPEPIRDRIVALKQLTDCTTSPVLQAATHEFCRRGLLEEHLDRVRITYRKRRDAMVEALREFCPPAVSWTEPDGGLVLWVTLPGELDARDVLAEARASNVVFNLGELFYIDSPRRNHLRLTFGGLPPGRIRSGIEVLGGVLHRLAKGAAGDRRPVRGEVAPLV